MQSKEARKKSKAAAKTHERKVKGQFDVGSCFTATNESSWLTKKNPQNCKTSASREVLGVENTTASLGTTNGDSRLSYMVS